MTASAWNLIKLDATKILHSLTESDIVKRNGNDEVVFKYDLSRVCWQNRTNKKT